MIVVVIVVIVVVVVVVVNSLLLVLCHLCSRRARRHLCVCARVCARACVCAGGGGVAAAPRPHVSSRRPLHAACVRACVGALVPQVPG